MDKDNYWHQVSQEITSLSLAMETFEEGDPQQQTMLMEIMLRCAQRLTCHLEDLHQREAKPAHETAQ